MTMDEQGLRESLGLLHQRMLKLETTQDTLALTLDTLSRRGAYLQRELAALAKRMRDAEAFQVQVLEKRIEELEDLTHRNDG